MSQTPPSRVAEVAANVRAEVARRRITQQAIGERLELDQRAVSRRLLGRVEWSAIQLVALAELLDLDPKVLVDNPEPAQATGT